MSIALVRTASRPIVATLFAALLSGPTVSAQNGAFSLTLTFDDAPIGVDSGGSGPYIDYRDPGGRTPSVYSNGSNFVMDLRGSSRTLCLHFPTAQLGSLEPAANCSPVQMNTLTTPDNGGISSLSCDTKDFSMVIYFTAIGGDGKSHDYNLAFRRLDGSGITANEDCHGMWTVTPLGLGRVSVYLKGKAGGWVVVKDYDMPFRFVATAQVPNLRGK